jgi:hypothetical protein
LAWVLLGFFCIRGFFCFVKVSIMLVRGFLVGSLWFYWVFYVG